jgi:hypothetical protein
MTNAYENVNLIKCLYVTHDAHTQPPMITKTTLQIYGPHLQQDITSTRSASLKKIPCSAYPVVLTLSCMQHCSSVYQEYTKSNKKPTSHEIFFFKTTKVVNSSQNPEVANSSSNPQIMKFCYPQVTNPS